MEIFRVKSKWIVFLAAFGLVSLILAWKFWVANQNMTVDDQLPTVFACLCSFYFFYKAYANYLHPFELHKNRIVYKNKEHSYSQIVSFERSWIPRRNLDFSWNPFGAHWYYTIKTDLGNICFHGETYQNVERLVASLELRSGRVLVSISDNGK